MIKKIALVTVAALLLTACQMNQDQAKNQPDKQHPGTKTESPAYKEIDAAKEVNAYHEIEELLEKEQPQWPQVRQVYEGKLRSIVQGRSPEADQLIDAYLNAGQSGQAKVKEVEEVVLKTLQRSAYEGIKTILKEKIPAQMAHHDQATQLLEQAKALYEGVLKETAEKRDGNMGTITASEIDTAFAEAKKALHAGDKLGYALQKQAIDKTLIRVFYLSTLHDAEEVVTAIKEEPEEVKAEQLEGFAFFQAIKKSLSEKAPEQVKQIEAQLAPNADPKKVDPQAIRQAFVKAFSAKAQGYMDKVLGESWNDRHEAAEDAFEGNLFIKAIELDLEKALGQAEKEKVMQAATQFFAAAKSGDKAQAERQAGLIRAALKKAETYHG
ncbi:hypothetical protein JIR001_00500 [Polycladomyces abyssicola]|uniref:Lipoprotein n=1 Tax=Polycladomyces abyssicola TaxID=1125966 RepID=A0A8D5ZLX1_9BACL|nr:hypothetical protein [Polycladomyces abyssicola]BCU80267.1 hypothetical protein JIR001_00500 [Polycladomyces abyssicola]